MPRTGWVVVRRTILVSPSENSMARVVSETSTVTVWCLCIRPRATFWPQTMTTPVLEARRCTRIGSGGGPWWRAGRANTAQPCDLLGVQRVLAGAQQLAGVEVVEHQRGWFDPDPDPAAAEDLRGQQLVPGQGHWSEAGDAAFHLDCLAVLDRWQRPRTGRHGPLSHQLGQVVDGKVGADGLDPGAADEHMDQVAVGPDPRHQPRPVGAHPELPLRHHQVPAGRNHPVELDRAT